MIQIIIQKNKSQQLRTFSASDYECLEYLLYCEDTTLLSAYSVYLEQRDEQRAKKDEPLAVSFLRKSPISSSRLPQKPPPPPPPTQRSPRHSVADSSAWYEFYDTLARLIQRESSPESNIEHSGTHLSVLCTLIRQLHEAGEMEDADRDRLLSLAQSPEGDIILEAAFSLYLRDENLEEFLDTLLSLARKI